MIPSAVAAFLVFVQPWLLPINIASNVIRFVKVVNWINKHYPPPPDAVVVCGFHPVGGAWAYGWSSENRFRCEVVSAKSLRQKKRP